MSRRSVGSVTVVDLMGRLGAGPGDLDLAKLRAASRDLIAAGRLDVVVNLCGLTQIDAHGLGGLAVMMKTMQTAGGRVTLVAASGRVARMLAVTRLDSVFEWNDAEGVLA